MHEVISGLALAEGMTVLDATLGGAGHAEAISEQIGSRGTLIGLDQDPDALVRAEERLSRFETKRILREANFRDLEAVLAREGVHSLDRALFDLGWSQNQLELSGRGFSFQRSEPLLMTFGKGNEGLTAYEIANTWSEEDLSRIIREYGEERFSGRIARGIVEERSLGKIETTFDLVRAIERNIPGFYKSGRIHPATRTFQAFRIAVNDELGVIETALAAAFQMLSVGGRIAVISFHSLEDRIVKNFFRTKKMSGEARLYSKKPVEASDDERTENPRSRSAKLRIVIKNPQ